MSVRQRSHYHSFLDQHTVVIKVKKIKAVVFIFFSLLVEGCCQSKHALRLPSFMLRFKYSVSAHQEHVIGYCCVVNFEKDLDPKVTGHLMAGKVSVKVTDCKNFGIYGGEDSCCDRLVCVRM